MPAKKHRSPAPGTGLENWDDLRFFLAVARAGGLSAASRDLKVNQSTVFRRIAQLEERLGARLFDRGARGYSLTGVGERMLDQAIQVEDEILALGRAVSGADHELSGVIRVATVDEILERMAPHLQRFGERYPRIELEVTTEQRRLSLTRREADVAIRPGQSPTEPDVVGRKLMPLRSAAYASTAYLATHPRPRRLTDLRHHGLVEFARGHRAEALLRERVPEARVVFRADSMRAKAIAAAAGIGVTVLPMFLGEHHAHLERLFSIKLPVEVSLWLIIHADLRQTARVRAFVDFMTEALQGERKAFGADRARA